MSCSEKNFMQKLCTFLSPILPSSTRYSNHTCYMSCKTFYIMHLRYARWTTASTIGFGIPAAVQECSFRKVQLAHTSELKCQQMVGIYNKASLNRAMCLYNKSNTSSTLHNSNSINKESIKQRSNGPPKEPQEGPARKDLNHQL